MRRFQATYFHPPRPGQIGPQEERVEFEAKSAAEAKRIAKASVVKGTQSPEHRARLYQLVEWLGAVGDCDKVNPII